MEFFFVLVKRNKPNIGLSVAVAKKRSGLNCNYVLVTPLVVKELSLDQKDLFQAELSELRKRKASEALEDQDMELLLKGVILKNISMRGLADNPYLSEFFRNHNIQLPGRKKLRSTINNLL